MKLSEWPGTKKTSDWGLPNGGSRIHIPNCFTHLYASFAVYRRFNTKQQEGVWEYAERLRDFLLQYTLAACCGEARHCTGQIHYYRPFLHEVKHPLWSMVYERAGHKGGELGRDHGGEMIWHWLKSKDYTYKQAFALLEGIFSRPAWSNAYGGPNWGFICRTGKELSPTNDRAQTMIALDTMAHVAHASAGLLCASKFNWATSSENIVRLMHFKRHAQPCCWLQLHGSVTSFPPYLLEKLKAAYETEPPHSHVQWLSYTPIETIAVAYSAQTRYRKDIYKAQLKKVQARMVDDISKATYHNLEDVLKTKLKKS